MLSNVIAVLTLAAALGAAGCEATFTPPSPVVSVYSGGLLTRAQVVPAEIWAYPRVYFGGQWVYLVDGLWYTPTSRGWMIYRQEPAELSRERVRIYAAQPYEFNLRVSPRTNPRVVPRTPYPAYPEYNPPPLQPPVELNRERTPSPPY